jgi:HK97 family phage major capsid protein
MTMNIKAHAELAAARAINEKAIAEGRELSQSEIDAATAHLQEYERMKSEPARGFNSSPEVKSVLDALGLNGAGGSAKASAPGPGFVAQSKSRWAADVAERLVKSMPGPGGSKALVSGTIDVPSVIGQPVEVVTRPRTILDLIQTPSSPSDGNGNTFQYLRQTARTVNAAAVPDNATKPTSTFTFGDVESKFSVYAHMSEALPLRYLTDFRGLTDILQDQLAAGLLEAIENDIIDGDGTADAFTGILNTSGIQTQAWTTDLLTTMSAAKYKLVNSFLQPTAWVLHPNDLQRLEQLKDTTGRFLFDGLAGIEAHLGYPVVTNNGLTAGVGVLGDFSTVELLVREDDHVDIDTGGTLFEKNQFRARVEGRYGLKVGRPLGFVSADLTA